MWLKGPHTGALLEGVSLGTRNFQVVVLVVGDLHGSLFLLGAGLPGKPLTDASAAPGEEERSIPEPGRWQLTDGRLCTLIPRLCQALDVEGGPR